MRTMVIFSGAMQVKFIHIMSVRSSGDMVLLAGGLTKLTFAGWRHVLHF